MFTKFSYEPHMETKWRSLKQLQHSEIQNILELGNYEKVNMNKLNLWQILKINRIQPIHTTLFAVIHSFVINLKQHITEHLPK